MVAVASSTLPTKGMLSGRNSSTPKVGLSRYMNARIPARATRKLFMGAGLEEVNENEPIEGMRRNIFGPP